VYHSANIYTTQGKATWELQQAVAVVVNSRWCQSARIEQFVTSWRMQGQGMRSLKMRMPKNGTRFLSFLSCQIFVQAKDQPFSIFKQYTLSLNENSALHKDLKSWRGKSFTEAELKSFDMANILGVNCDIEVEHTAGGRAKIVSIFKPDGGAKKVATVNDQVMFDLEDYCKEFSGESCDESKAACDIFADLPAFLCEMIEGIV
jgi:hypothetical protein